jgi:hypothetical protein
MASPPSSPPELHGASHVTGGTTRGNAVGNVMNIADADNTMDMVVKRMGKIHLYDSLVDPTETKPKRVLKVDVNFSMAPILKAIAPKWSPIYSKPVSHYTFFDILLNILQKQILPSLHMKIMNGMSKGIMRLPLNLMKMWSGLRRQMSIFSQCVM